MPCPFLPMLLSMLLSIRLPKLLSMILSMPCPCSFHALVHAPIHPPIHALFNVHALFMLLLLLLAMLLPIICSLILSMPCPCSVHAPLNAPVPVIGTAPPILCSFPNTPVHDLMAMPHPAHAPVHAPVLSCLSSCLLYMPCPCFVHALSMLLFILFAVLRPISCFFSVLLSWSLIHKQCRCSTVDTD
jgi:hypothetical protein